MWVAKVHITDLLLHVMADVFLTTVSMAVGAPRRGIHSAATVVALVTLEPPAIPVSVCTHSSFQH